MITLNDRLMARLQRELGDTPQGQSIISMVSLPLAFTAEPKLRELLTQLRDAFTEVLEG